MDFAFYTYNALGYITNVKKNGTTIASYGYDALGQLVTENNAETGQIYIYSYDKAGNITQKLVFTGDIGNLTDTINYTYSTSAWGDLLTNYDGTAITYDSIGNPTNWRNASNLTWDGRELVSAITDNYGTINYTYNADGIRTRKYISDESMYGDITYDYVLDGSKIIKETVTDTAFGNSYTLYYVYDANGSITGLHYNGSPYYFQKSIQGDVLRICDTGGTVVVEYTYDAWGNILSVTGSLASTLGQYNPFRYRGYYYDSETGLYYLNSRYYDPQVGRFINADGIVGANGGILGYNMFAYCNNNPVMGYDPMGEYNVASRTFVHKGASDYLSDAIGLGLVLGVGGTIILSSSDILVEPIEGLIDGIGASLKKAKEQIKEKAKDIAESLPKLPKFHVHHIVAKADPRAAEARQILYDVGIDPWSDPRNLVVLPQGYHVSLHTTAYYEYVTERLRLVAGDKAGVEATLASLKAEILARSVIGIRWE